MRRTVALLVFATAVLVGKDGIASVPVPFGSQLIEPTGRGITANTTIRILSRWDTLGYQIQADFSRLDGNAGGGYGVVDSLPSSYLIVYTTGPMTGLADTSGIVIPITAFNPADSTRFTDLSFTVCRNNTTPLPVHLTTRSRNDQTLYHAGDSLIVFSRWKVERSRNFLLVPDYRNLVPSFQPDEARIRDLGLATDSSRTFEVDYKLPGASRLAPDRTGIPVVLVGRDSLCSEVRSSDLTIDLKAGVTVPGEIATFVRSPVDRGVHSFDTINILSEWDSVTVGLRADFSRLDNGAGGVASVIDSAGTPGFFIIQYTTGSMTGLPDDTVHIPITGVNGMNDTFTTTKLKICRNLGTRPPYYVQRPYFRAGVHRFHPGDSLIVLSRWKSPTGLKIDVVPDFQNIVPAFKPAEALVQAQGADTFRVAYGIPSPPILGPDGNNLRISIKARDAFCGVTVFDSLFVDIDATPPSEVPVFDPLPAATNEGTVCVSGIAPGAARVAIVRNDPPDLHTKFQFYTPVDSAGHFNTCSTIPPHPLALAPGKDVVGGWSEDELGNRTTIGTSQVVQYVTLRSTSYPTPFRPDSVIVLRDGAGMREATVEIYNLEGDAVFKTTRTGPPFLIEIPWDGRDGHGDRAQPGYYLMRVHRVSVQGKSHDEVLPMLFRNR